MIAFHDFASAFRDLEIPEAAPVIAHASLSAFGQVQGGAESLLGAMIHVFPSLIMPAFTYKTMLIPEVGPPDNGLVYGQGRESNYMAQFFQPDLPVDRLMGIVPEMLRRHPRALRSSHPILSFVGLHAEEILASQSIDQPLEPIGGLWTRAGWVLLNGVDQEVNTSIHYAEFLSGRRQFIRWALTETGVHQCPGFPGCSDGFRAITERLRNVIRQVTVGTGRIMAIPLEDLIATVRSWLEIDPFALLCDRTYCERCEAVRLHLRQSPGRMAG